MVVPEKPTPSKSLGDTGDTGDMLQRSKGSNHYLNPNQYLNHYLHHLEHLLGPSR